MAITDIDCSAGNIRKGIDIAGRLGTYDNEATNPVKASDIVLGKVAFVNGSRVDGILPSTLTGEQDFLVEYGESLSKNDLLYFVRNHMMWDNAVSCDLSPISGDVKLFPVALDFSRDAEYLAVGRNTYDINGRPRLSIYKRNGDSFYDRSTVYVPVPNVLPFHGETTDVAWSPDGVLLAQSLGPAGLGQTGIANGLFVYRRDGDSMSVVYGVTSPYTALLNSVAWSPDGVYLAASTTYNSSSGSNGICILKRNGNTISFLTSITLSHVHGVAWSADSTYLACMTTASPFIEIWKRSGDTFTQLSSPAEVPVNEATALAWSPDGTYLALSCNKSPHLFIYKHSRDIFTRLPDSNMPNQAWPPATYGIYDMLFTPDGRFLIVSCASLGRSTGNQVMTIYHRNGDKFIPIVGEPQPSASHGGSRPLALGYSSITGQYYMAYGESRDDSTNSFYLWVWKGGSESLLQKAYKSVNTFSELQRGDLAGVGYVKENGVAGDTKTVAKVWNAEY